GNTIEVTWRSGVISTVSNVQANCVYEIDEEGVSGALTSAATKMKIFEDASDLLNHTHVASLVNDFERQPLLPRQLSRTGPDVAWRDLNGDGWEDLVIGSEFFINQK